MKKIFFLLFLPSFLQAQISVTVKTGQLYSFSKNINKGNPSPYFSVSPYVSIGFFGVNIGYIHGKYSFDFGWEYTDVGSQTHDNTAAILCADCKDAKEFNSAYGVPIQYLPLRFGYNIYTKKHLDVFAKVGYFQTARRYDPIAFANSNNFAPYTRPDFRYDQIDGTPFTKVSRNLQADINMVYTVGKKKKYGLSLDLIFNLGLKKLSEDKYITTLYKTNETYTNYVTRRGSFVGFNIGYIRIFQDSKPKIRKTKPKKYHGRYF